MRRFIFIVGGTKSGKSRYAVELAKRIKKKTAFIATAAALDKEMVRRINMHRSSRPRSWKLIEEKRDPASRLLRLETGYGAVIIDCLGLLISNLLADGLKDKEIEKRIEGLIKTISGLELTTILVSNDVGSGIVPDNHLARRFADLLGSANQKIAKKADEVIFMQSGIPLRIKRKPQDA